MKRIFSLILAVLLAFTLAACNTESGGKDKKDKIEQAESLSEINERIGVDMTIPATAKDAEYAVVNELTAQATFTLNSIIYVFRASKIYSGEQLHGKNLNTAERSIEIGDRATVTYCLDEQGGAVVQWTAGGTNYAFTSVKPLNDDIVTELCDLIIS